MNPAIAIGTWRRNNELAAGTENTAARNPGSTARIVGSRLRVGTRGAQRRKKTGRCGLQFLAANLLRRHVGDRAHGHTGQRKPQIKGYCSGGVL